MKLSQRTARRRRAAHDESGAPVERVRSEGARLLAQTGKTQAEIAARVDRSRTLVAYWLSGDRLPGKEDRAALFRAYGIPLDAWDRAIGKRPKAARESTPPPAPAASTPSAPPPPPDADGERPTDDVTVRGRALDLARYVDELCKEARQRDSGNTPLERAKILASCAATLKLLGTMTGETLEISEARILRLPAFSRIQEELVRALMPFPDALKAAGDALVRLGSRL